jgi:hypothetical protein
MDDPPRLLASRGSPESLLLRSAPRLDPPPQAEREVWRKLMATLALGSVASSTSAAAYAASGGTRVLGKLAWSNLLKWGAVLAVGLPAVGATTYVALQHRTRMAATVASAPGPRVESTPGASGAPAASDVPPPLATSNPAPAIAPAPKVAAAPAIDRTAGRTEPHAMAPKVDAPSALRAESQLLAAARSRFAAGDYSGALAQVERLRSRFPSGRLMQEREVVAIDALAAMGEHAAARARAAAFLQRFGDSPYATHVRQMLES